MMFILVMVVAILSILALILLGEREQKVLSLFQPNSRREVLRRTLLRQKGFSKERNRQRRLA